MSADPKVGVVIPAAGQGVRVGGEVPKQFRPIAGIPMLLRTIRPFAAHPRVTSLVVVLPSEQVDSPPDWLAELLSARLVVTAGGSSRTESVWNGLTRLPAECRTVLVHDAARPFVTREIIDAVIATVEGGTGAVAAVPVRDTLKRSEGGPGSPRISDTVDRSGLWRAQTPQGFDRQVLERAYQRMKQMDSDAPTDEAALVEQLGEPIVLVMGSEVNFKITTSEDFQLAEILAKA